MSIITIKKRQVSWDSAVSTGNGSQQRIASTDNKMRIISKLGDDLLVGGVGNLSTIHDFQVKLDKMSDVDFRDWFSEGWGSPDKDTTLIAYNPRTGHIRESATDSSNLYGMSVDIYAIGAGWQVAIGAMWAGASPREATQIVCDRVFGCDSPIFQYDKGKIRKYGK
jgi:hypothetical protein